MSKIKRAEIAHYEATIIRKKVALPKAKSNTSRAYIQAGITHSIDAIERIKAGMVKS